MKLNRGEIRTQIRNELGDKKSPFKWGTSLLNTRIDIWHDKIVEYSDLLQKWVTYASVKYQRKYAFPDDYLAISKKWGLTFDGERIYPIDIYREDIRNKAWRTQSSGTPDNYYVSKDGSYLCLDPKPSAAADTTTLNGALTIAAVEITLTSTSDLEEEGAIIVGTEVIHYNAKSTTQILGCTRGAEDTTAAVHSDAATVTKRDIGLTYNERPVQMTSDGVYPFNELPQYENYAISIVHAVSAQCLGKIPEKIDAAKFQYSLFAREQAKLKQKAIHHKDRRHSIQLHPSALRR